MYADVEETIIALSKELEELYQGSEIGLVGDFARKMEIISSAEWLIGMESLFGGKEKLKNWGSITWDMSASGPFAWRGKVNDLDLLVKVHFCSKKEFVWKKCFSVPPLLF
ncbi:hypothetical protein V8V91_09145 [Algoriphagus halophilus]